ncbi:hypothetical protein BOTBODRAFT_63746 [Botryobasidium botryosum FD-172 SS1]|uniref:Uncharacterized protein n=1 Tax=Botryobasidium botryosum (strain FD-172 SS1) TaxID=930990 RepID=A0A067MTI0_BOTB1|nr:hypothetical protein BOTBODRAFT_63746 [Botryobasidium botryosum FD-172 SS1]
MHLPLPFITIALSAFLVSSVSAEGPALAAGQTYVGMNTCTAGPSGGSPSANPILVASTSGACKCGDRSDALAAGDTICAGPTNGASLGEAGCINNSASGPSSCTVNCVEGYQPKDGKTCNVVAAADGVPTITKSDDTCKDQQFLLKTDKGCMCNYNANYPGTTQCKKPASGNGNGVCSTNGISWATCSVVCSKDYEEKNGDCVKKTAVTPTPNPNPNPNPNPTPGTLDQISTCPPHLPAAYAIPGGGCGCATAGKAKAVACVNPASGHGVSKCRSNAAKTSSECYIECDTDYKLENGACVPTAVEKTLSIDDCTEDPNFWLSAVPGGGCKCLSSQTAQWCDPAKTTNGEGGACYQNAPLTDVHCTVTSCDTNFKPQGDQCVPTDKITLISSCTAATGYNLLPSASGCTCSPRGSATACYDPPSGHGEAACKESADKSRIACTVSCDANFKPSADGKDCVPA